MLTKLLLIRHGQTDCNLEKKYSGFLDVDINAAGKQQARLLYKRLKEGIVHKVYSSDRLRAVHFARIVFSGRKIEKIPDLRELHFGRFEGLTYQQIMEKYPGIYQSWLSHPFRTSIPQGESLDKFQKRILKAISRIVSDNIGKTIAIVCHGGVISIFINSILGIKDFWKYAPDSASLSIVEYRNDKPELRLFNDISYLTD